MVHRYVSFSLALALLLIWAIPSQAGGFLHRLKKNRCCGVSVCASPAPCSCASSCATQTTNCCCELHKNLGTCDRLYANDPAGRCQCAQIANELYQQCVNPPTTPNSANSYRAIAPCAFAMPEVRTPSTCLNAYHGCSGQPSNGCCAQGYFDCVNGIGTAPGAPSNAPTAK